MATIPIHWVSRKEDEYEEWAVYGPLTSLTEDRKGSAAYYLAKGIRNLAGLVGKNYTGEPWEGMLIVLNLGAFTLDDLAEYAGVAFPSSDSGMVQRRLEYTIQDLLFDLVDEGRGALVANPTASERSVVERIVDGLASAMLDDNVFCSMLDNFDYSGRHTFWHHVIVLP